MRVARAEDRMAAMEQGIWEEEGFETPYDEEESESSEEEIPPPPPPFLPHPMPEHLAHAAALEAQQAFAAQHAAVEAQYLQAQQYAQAQAHAEAQAQRYAQAQEQAEARHGPHSHTHTTHKTFSAD